ncbi:MAG: hypothetical protein PF441_05185 [Desulfuromusa sp.]|jgi:uncharacterized ion transporter superfamily protein YfcC|nr:hypothetical protein [Desulfuromusa sp.]
MVKKKQRKSVFKEARDNMSEDFNKFMPEKLRAQKGKKKFVLWLFILEVVVLGVLGRFIYKWWLES